MTMYQEGHRLLQDQFDSRRLADRVEEVIVHDRVNDEDREFIARMDLFFLATVDAEGRPQCSYKGGPRGFVRVVDEATLAFPSYDGNGMFLSLGNLHANPNVAMLFIDFEDPRRLRVNGTASARRDDPLLAEYPEAQLIVRVAIRQMFINCPRYIHRYQRVEDSAYVPRAGCETPIPDWKRLDVVQDVLPQKDRQ